MFLQVSQFIPLQGRNYGRTSRLRQAYSGLLGVSDTSPRGGRGRPKRAIISGHWDILLAGLRNSEFWMGRKSIIGQDSLLSIISGGDRLLEGNANDELYLPYDSSSFSF